MALSDRLRTLSGQSGAGGLRGVPLADRLQGLSAGTRQPAVSKAAEQALVRRLNGRQLSEGLILKESRLSPEAGHGARLLRSAGQRLTAVPGMQSTDPRRLVFLDTETTGLSHGCGTRIFLLGLLRIDRGLLHLRQYLLSRFCGEAAMLDAAGNWLREDDILVTYNGKSFDLPLLGSRCRMSDLTDPFIRLAHMDLLYPVRRAFSSVWPDCRLVTAEQRLLSFYRSGDVPGSAAPAAWFDWLRNGRLGTLAAVCRHNRWDLMSLTALLPALSRVYRNPWQHGADMLSVARAHLRGGSPAAAFDVLSAGREDLDPRGLLELARLCRKRADWPQALSIWQRLAADGCGEATEHLAKYFEHVARDYSMALFYARRLPPPCTQRRQRLQRKLASCSMR